MTDQRTIFEIPAENMVKFEAQIAKISRKSVKLIGQKIEPFVFSHEDKQLSDGLTHRVYNVMLTAEIPSLNGWTFVARLDHSSDAEVGTIIRMVPNTGELPTHFRHAKNTTCDHCHVNRFRRDTFVIRNDETQEYKQVGSTCLKDFFNGNDPQKIAKLAELLGYAYECGRGGEQFVGGDLRWIDLEDALSVTASIVRTCGWVSGKTAYENPSMTSTKQRVWEHFNDRHFDVIDADREVAQQAQEWAANLCSKDTLSDYEHNICIVAKSTMIEPRSMGLAVSIVGVYVNHHQPKLAKTVDVGNFDGVIALFDKAKEHLSFPKIRLALEDGQPIVLSVAGNNAAKPGSVNITDGRPFGENTYFGRVLKDGTWERGRSVNQATMISLTALLSALASHPAETAAAYGKLTGNCCFCRKPLTDTRSTAVGYGKVCASHYSMPYPAR